MKIDITHYQADTDKPLIISFANFLAEYDVTTVMNEGFWEILGYTTDDGPTFALSTKRTYLKPKEIYYLTETIAPNKVLLLEPSDLQIDEMETIQAFCHSLGVSLYARNVGWLVAPGKPLLTNTEDLFFRMSSAYTQDNVGNWKKECRVCKKSLPTFAFYKQQQPGKRLRDPYRNICKNCSRSKWRATETAKTTRA